jgi:hypothetical protein
MTLRFRNLGFAVSAIYVVLFLAVVSVAAQDAGDITRLEPAVAAAPTRRGPLISGSLGMLICGWLALRERLGLDLSPPTSIPGSQTF